MCHRILSNINHPYITTKIPNFWDDFIFGSFFAKIPNQKRSSQGERCHRWRYDSPRILQLGEDLRHVGSGCLKWKSWKIAEQKNLRFGMQQTSGPRFPAAFRRGKVGIIRKLWKAEKATSGDPFATCLDVSSLSFWQGHSIVAIDIPKNSMEFWKKFKKPNERQGFICLSLGKQSMSRLLIWLIHKMPNLKCVPFITMPSQEKLHHWIVPHYFNSTAIWPTLHPTRHHFHRAPNGLLLQISPGFHQQPSATAVV